MSRRVIIVDDDKWSIQDIKESFQFTKWGYEIAGEYASAESAWAAIRTDMPDLIVSDIRMGHETGLDLAHSVAETHADTRFVIVSGYDDFAYVQQAFEYDVFYYLLKPLDDDKAQALMARIAESWPEPKPEHEDSFDRVLSYLNEHYRENITLSSTAQALFLNKSYVAQLCARHLGIPFTQYRNKLRIDHAKRAIVHGESNMTRLAEECGFESLSQFSKAFKQIEGLSPMQYRNTIMTSTG